MKELSTSHLFHRGGVKNSLKILIYNCKLRVFNYFCLATIKNIFRTKLFRIRGRSLAIAAFALLAMWNVGQGSYILAKAELAQWLIASAWQQSTTERTQIKPWPWADTWPVARLEMPNHDIDQYVLAGSSGASLAFGPGYILASAAPTEQGNTVIAAHRDTHFAFLEQVEVGEKIVITSTEGKTREYVIQDMRIVDKTDVGWINAEYNPYQLTLVTCYPFNALVPGGRLRYVVRAGMLPLKNQAGGSLELS